MSGNQVTMLVILIIYLVANVLGHKDVNTTRKHYAAIEEERRKNARNAVRLHKDNDEE